MHRGICQAKPEAQGEQQRPTQSQSTLAHTEQPTPVVSSTKAEKMESTFSYAALKLYTQGSQVLVQPAAQGAGNGATETLQVDLRSGAVAVSSKQGTPAGEALDSMGLLGVCKLRSGRWVGTCSIPHHTRAHVAASTSACFLVRAVCAGRPCVWKARMVLIHAVEDACSTSPAACMHERISSCSLSVSMV